MGAHAVALLRVGAGREHGGARWCVCCVERRALGACGMLGGEYTAGGAGRGGAVVCGCAWIVFLLGFPALCTSTQGVDWNYVERIVDLSRKLEAVFPGGPCRCGCSCTVRKLQRTASRLGYL